MAGWMLDDGSVVDCVKRVSEQKIVEVNGFCVDLEPPPKDFEPESEEFRCWFDQFLRIFLKEICAQESFWQLPPMVGDGRTVDLFKLFLVVRERGGYKTVSKNGLWDLVAKESGLEYCLSSSVKLVYFKYLDVLERWLERVADDRVNTKSKLSDCSSSLSEYLMELGAEFEGVLSNSERKDKEYLHLEESNCQLNSEGGLNVCRNDVSMVVESDEGEKCINDEESMHVDWINSHVDYLDAANMCNDVGIKSSVVELEREKYCFDDVTKGVVNSSDSGKVCNNNEVKSVVVVDSDGGKKCTDSDKESIVISESDVEKTESSSRKRKHDSTWKMLSWVIGIAKNPCLSLVGSVPEMSKWKSYGNDELWKQVLSYREAVFLKSHVDSNAEQSSWQKNQKMHPSMYDDHESSYNLRERLSCSKKFVLGDATTQSWAYPRSLSFGAQNDSDKRRIKNLGENGLLQSTDSTTTDSVFDYEVEKQIPIGPAFQVEVPEWTGVPSESDSKWLGIRVWPLENVEHRILIERDLIGKGRQDSCGCQFRDSFECVRFHIAEKRYKLKLELGSGFHNWKFDKMGEEAMLSWTEEEQKNFETIVRLNSTSIDRCLWDVIFKCFPTKNRGELVSYYFNVYLLRRRAHQNRFTPDDIDSDDDEELESGLAAKGFIHETIESTSSIFHSPNKKHKKSR